MPLNLKVYLNQSFWEPSDVMRSTALILNDGNFEEKIFSITESEEVFRKETQRFNKVEGVSAHDCLMMMKIPTNLTVFFPNMIALDIKNCGLKTISRNDLKGLEKLKQICLREMEIEELPADLFEDLINLEFIGLQSNKIKQIGRGIFNGLQNLKLVNLSGNPSVNLVYAVKTVARTFPEVLRFYKLEDLNNYLDEVFHTNAAQKTSNALGDSKGKYQGEPGPSGFKPQNDKNLFADILKILKCDDFKDFTIKIGENEFKVHKLMLAARSPKLAEMIKQNPDADELILEDIEVEVFKIILDFIYEDKMPENYDDDKSVKVLVAAAKLKIESVKIKVEKTLIEVVTPENSLEFLNLAAKYDCKELKKKAFEEFQKTLDS